MVRAFDNNGKDIDENIVIYFARDIGLILAKSEKVEVVLESYNIQK